MQTFASSLDLPPSGSTIFCSMTEHIEKFSLLGRLFRDPEASVTISCGNFLKTPFFAGLIEMNHWDGIKLCTLANLGDVGIAMNICFVAGDRIFLSIANQQR